jgi:hypothetical protein
VYQRLRERSDGLSKEAEDRKAAVVAALSELVESPGWDLVMASIRQTIRKNLHLLRMRDTQVPETQAARGALDALMVLVQYIYLTTGKELPADLKPLYE